MHVAANNIPIIQDKVWQRLKYKLQQGKLIILAVVVVFMIQALRFSLFPQTVEIGYRLLALFLLLTSLSLAASCLYSQYRHEKNWTLALITLGLLPINFLALFSLEDQSTEFSYRYLQVATFVNLFSLLYLFLRSNLLRLVNQYLERFRWNELTAYQQATDSKLIAHCELITGTVIIPQKNQMITKNCLVDSGEAVFDIMKQPFRWSKSFVTTGDAVPAGSYLVAGKVGLAVDSLQDEPYLSFLRDYFFTEKTQLSNNYLYLVLLVSVICSYLYLTFVEGNWSSAVVFLTGLLSFSYFCDLASIVKQSFPALKERLAARAIFCNDFSVLGQKSVSCDNIPSNLPVKKVSKLTILSDLISEERVALLIFYLTSYSEEADFQAIHEAMQSDYFQKYLNNPLENIRIYQNGFLAELEGISLCFGSEQFLLENGTVLNTNEVMGRAKNKHAYYLVLNKEVYAGIEVSDHLFQDCEEEVRKLLAGQKIVGAELELPTVNPAQLSKNLQIVEDRSANANAKDLNSADVLNLLFSKTFKEMVAEQRKYLLVYNLIALRLLPIPFQKMMEYRHLQKLLVAGVLLGILILLILIKTQFVVLQLISLIVFTLILILRKKLSDLLQF